MRGRAQHRRIDALRFVTRGQIVFLQRAVQIDRLLLFAFAASFSLDSCAIAFVRARLGLCQNMHTQRGLSAVTATRSWEPMRCVVSRA